jgi:hypothetical protein
MCGWIIIIGIIMTIFILAACNAGGKADEDTARYMEELKNE